MMSILTQNKQRQDYLPANNRCLLFMLGVALIPNEIICMSWDVCVSKHKQDIVRDVCMHGKGVL